MRRQPGRSQPGSASRSAAALSRCPRAGRQLLVPPLLHRPENGLDAFRGHRCREGGQGKPTSSPAPQKPVLWGGVGGRAHPPKCSVLPWSKRASSGELSSSQRCSTAPGRQFNFLSSCFLLLTQDGTLTIRLQLQALPTSPPPISPGSITNKSPRWEREPEETRGTKPQAEPFFPPCSP